jgi:hypothetical protein
MRDNQQDGRETAHDAAKEHNMTEKRPRGRPRIHLDAKAAARAASAAYRERKKARREAPEVQSSIIDLSALAAWKVKKRE